MQMMFGSTLLMRRVGINTNFFRAPDAETWSRIPWHLRTTLEEFCLKHLKDMIDIIQPKEIVIIGFSTLEKFSTATPFLRGTKNRVLMKKGQIFRRNAVATLHLSGARIASDDRRSIAQAIRSLVDRHTT